MSEINNKQNKTNVGTMIATVIVVLAAVSAMIVMVLIIMKDREEPQSENFTVTQELVDECLVNAHDLVASNYEVIKLYITEGLPHLDEPYGNEPEDGVYTVDSENYKTPDDMKGFLKRIYTEQAAEELWNRGVYKTRYMKDGLAMDYNAAGVEEVLGISADFVPNESYSVNWSSSPVEVVPTAEDKCTVKIYVNGASPEDPDIDTANVLTTEMVKENGSWRLSEFVS